MPSGESTCDRCALDGGPTSAQKSSRLPVAGPATDGGLVEAPHRGVEGDDGIRRTHVDHVDEGLDPDRVLGGEDRALELGGRHQPPASAGRDPRHERVGQSRTAACGRIRPHAVESIAPRWLSMRSSSLGCAEMAMASS